MTIWNYGGANDDVGVVRAHVGATACAYCAAPMDRLPSEIDDTPNALPGINLSVRIESSYCPVCGWWWSKTVRFSRVVPERTIIRLSTDDVITPHEHWALGASGTLKSLDVACIDVPMREVRQYLAARYDKRFTLHPRQFEKLVASVFSDHGYSVMVTGYSGDGGIDVILTGRDGKSIGVQVKRYKSAIEIEQIRALVGALLINGHTRGMFVTTSSFQRGAALVARRATQKGIAVELIDAKRFFEALSIAQRARYESARSLPMIGTASVTLDRSSHPLFPLQYSHAVGRQRMQDGWP